MTVTKTMKEAIWLQRLLDDLRIDQDLNNCDSMSAIYLVKNQIYHARTTSGTTLFGRFLMRVTSSCKRFTRRRIPLICLPRLFRE